MLFEVDITNNGGADASNIRLVVRIPEAYFKGTRVETNDTNRPDPGALFETTFGRLAPGESITVTFEIQGKAASVALGAPTQIKTRIKTSMDLREIHLGIGSGDKRGPRI